jgi:hypothetical protein
MTHPTTVRHAIWDAIRMAYRTIRRAVATALEHGGPAIVVSRSAAEVEAVLGRAYFAPNWEFSYYERGEDTNLARVVYEEQSASGHPYVWWQTHVRGWTSRAADGQPRTRLRAHFELEPTEYDQDHLNGVGLDIPRGIDTVAAVLEEAGVTYDRHEDLPPGGS